MRATWPTKLCREAALEQRQHQVLRVFEQGAVSLNEQAMKQAEQGVQIHDRDVLRVGKDRKVALHGGLALRTEVAASAA